MNACLKIHLKINIKKEKDLLHSLKKKNVIFKVLMMRISVKKIKV